MKTMNNKVFLGIGRHGRYGYDTAIDRQDMIKAYLMGKQLKNILPQCKTVYHSPLARAVETAHFAALGLNCNHILSVETLNEDSLKYDIKKFFNNLIKYTDNSVKYYHFVTHLPVIEKLGLPFLATGEVCLLLAKDWQNMMCENFDIQIIKSPSIPFELWKKLDLTNTSLENMNSDEIYNKIKYILY